MPKNPTVCRALAIMDSYHDFAKIQKLTAKDKAEAAAAAAEADETGDAVALPEEQNANAYVKAFRSMVIALLKQEGQAICAAKSTLDPASEPGKFYKAFCEFVGSGRKTGYEYIGMDLFFTHYFKSAPGLYIRKSERKKAAASIILASERSSAHTLSDDLSLPTETLRTRPGALTISVHTKSEASSKANRNLYQFLCKVYGTKRMQYFLDAEPIGPGELCAVDNKQPVAAGIFYNGIGRMYDPGNSAGILVNKAIIDKSARCDEVDGNPVAASAAVGGDSESSAAQLSRASRASLRTPPLKSVSPIGKAYKPAEISDKAKEALCYFSPARSYSLSKAGGELLFFDELIFSDKCPPNPRETEIVAVVGDNRVHLNSLRIVRLTNSQNGIRNYMIAAGKVVELAKSASKDSMTRQQRKKILKDVHSASYSIMLSAFRLSYDPNLWDGTKPIVSKTIGPNATEGKPYYTLGARDYSMALLDLKRSGDYGLVASAAAATRAMNPKDTVPIVITLDRMAAVYALYSGVACMYVMNYDKERHVKLFNFDKGSLAATEPLFTDTTAIPVSVLATRPMPAPEAPARAVAAGGAFAIGSPARAAAARPVTRASSRFAQVAAPAARPSTAPPRPSESARKFAPLRAPADRQNAPPPRVAVRAEPPEFAEAPDGAAAAPDPEFAKYANTRFPPFAKFADMLADLARGDPASAELLSPVNVLTYSFLHHYLRND